MSDEIVIREATRADEDALTTLAFEYLSWAVERLRDDYGVEWPPLDRAEVREGLDEYRSGGVVLIAEHAGSPVGMGAVRLLDDHVAEIKRMYVRADARGARIGSRLLDVLLGTAADLGAAIVRLDTIRFMTDAQRLYRSRGFVERAPYEGTEIPVALQHHWLFFERDLARAPE